MLSLAVGAVDTSLDIQIVDDSGLPVTGLVAATFPTIIMSKGAGADITISLVDLALLTSAHADGGVKERSGGYYRFDPPDSIATTAKIVRLRGEETDKRLICPPIQVGLQDALVDALEDAVSALGDAIAQADNDTSTGDPLVLIVGELVRPRSVTCLNSDGTNRDLTDWGPKVLVIERPNKTADVQVVEDADLTISGADNHIFTFQPSATVLARAADYVWSLREVSTGHEIISGRIAVRYSPLEDTP